MESGLLLDVVVGKGSAVFELLSSEDESLLIRGNSFLVLDLSLDVFDAVGVFDIEGDGFSCECFNEDLHVVDCYYSLILYLSKVAPMNLNKNKSLRFHWSKVT